MPLSHLKKPLASSECYPRSVFHILSNLNKTFKELYSRLSGASVNTRHTLFIIWRMLVTDLILLTTCHSAIISSVPGSVTFIHW